MRTSTIAVIALVALIAVVSAIDHKAMFESFKARYGRKYASQEEEAKRFDIFVTNMKRAAKLSRANPLATFGVNDFADMSAAEFKKRHNSQALYAKLARKGGRGPAALFGEEQIKAGVSKIDWRQKGAVTAVKDQGQCGSCWSFSTTGGIEGQWFLAGNTLTSVSEQYLVSCDTTCYACDGCFMDTAFAWLIANSSGVIYTEASYPYVSGNGNVPACKTTGNVFGAQISAYKDLPHDEDQMATWVGQNGPLTIAVDASAWSSYTGGIMTNCGGVQLDHGVLIVGFDNDNKPPYWIVKNSWSATWGESGYIRIEKGTNQCLINNSPSTSIVGGSPAPTPVPTSPTPAPTPTPASGSFTQTVCTDSQCTQSCQGNTFQLNTCLVSGSGSAFATSCTSSGLVLTFYSSSDCSGTGQPSTQPVNQCVQDIDGSYLENTCSSRLALSKARVALRKL